MSESEVGQDETMNDSGGSESFLKRNQLAGFFFLAFTITWVAVFPLALSGQGIGGISVSEDWHFLGAFGPTVAAIIMAYMTKESAGVRDLAARCVQWRRQARWVGIAVVLPFVIFSLAVVFDFAVSGTWFDWNQFLVDNQLSDVGSWLLWFLPVFSYGIFEEIGWRGFALPRLQKKYSALVATGILTAFWGPWHLPMFFYRFDYPIPFVMMWFVGLFFGALLLTFFLNSSDGSLLVVIIWHTGVNIVSRLDVVTLAAYSSMMMMVLGILLLLRFGWRDFSAGEKYVEE
ncbi:MAG: CPBP family intramembrane glutamic endopeptidase [Candidatus Hermodarchaeota archaeon]